jgi:hypothetical protein
LRFTRYDENNKTELGCLSVLGALVSRFGWIAAGKVSNSDPESVLAAER